MMYGNVIVDITISRDLFVFSQSRVKVSTSLTNIGSLAVGAIDLVPVCCQVRLCLSRWSVIVVAWL